MKLGWLWIIPAIWFVWGIVASAVFTWREIREGSTYTVGDLIGALFAVTALAQFYTIFELVELFQPLFKIVVFGKGRKP